MLPHACSGSSRTWPTAATWVKMSGAPLPNESRVAPATAGDSARYSDISSSAGQKKRSDSVSTTASDSSTPATSSSSDSHCLRQARTRAAV